MTAKWIRVKQNKKYKSKPWKLTEKEKAERIETNLAIKLRDMFGED